MYEWVETTLLRMEYASLDKPGKGLVRRYLCRMTGLSRAQVNALDSAATPHGTGESGGLSADQVRHALHRCGRQSAGLCRQGAREPKRTGDVPNPRTRAPRLRASSCMCGWHRFRWRTFTGGATVWLIGNATPVISPHGQRRFRLASGASRNRAANRDFCASTPCVREINSDAKVSITSMPTTK